MVAILFFAEGLRWVKSKQLDIKHLLSLIFQIKQKVIKLIDLGKRKEKEVMILLSPRCGLLRQAGKQAARG